MQLIAGMNENNNFPDHLFSLGRTVHPSTFTNNTADHPRLENRQSLSQRSRRIPASQSPVSDDQIPTSSAPGASRRQIPNPFGTREEIESEEYQSPLTQMFGRAWNRYREHEANRQQSASLEIQMDLEPSTNNDNDLDFQARRGPFALDLLTPTAQLLPTAESFLAIPRGEPINPIDQQSTRPPALGPADLIISVACRICCEQMVDTLLEPCMHVAICHWCSEVIRAQGQRRRNMPRHNNTGRLERGWKCPICRRDVMQARRVFLS